MKINTIDQILDEIISEDYSIRHMVIDSQKEDTVNRRKKEIVERFIEVLDALHDQKNHFSALEKMDNFSINYGDPRNNQQEGGGGRW